MWQLKLLGSLLFTLSTGAIGLKKARNLACRCALLEKTQAFIIQTADRIRCGECEIPEILKQTLPKEITVNDRKVFVSGGILKEEDRIIIEEFLNGVGMGDFITEEKRCSLYLSRINECKTKADNERKEKSRLYSVGGFSAGLMLSLLWI